MRAQAWIGAVGAGILMLLLGSYEALYQESPASAQSTCVGEPDNDFITTTHSIEVGTLANPKDCNETLTPGDVDYFKILYQGGNVYVVTVTVPSTSSLKVGVSLQDFGGNQLFICEEEGIRNVPCWSNGSKDSPARLRWFQSSSAVVYLKIQDQSEITGTYTDTYTLTAQTIGTATPTPTGIPLPTSTPTPLPTPTPAGFPDAFEPNYDFDHATLIGLGRKYTGLNFVPVVPGTEDNDFFKLWVKPGMLITCETMDLTPGTDTNLIVYDANRNGIAGNDDINSQAGELGSRVTVMTTWEGWMYLLVGQGGRGIVYGSGYSLQCTVGLPPTPTPTPTRTPRPITVVPPPPTATPFPTSTSVTTTPPPVRLQVQALAATPTPVGRAVEVMVEVYYDANGNGAPDPGEGVVDLPAWLISLRGGQVIARGMTDDAGRMVLRGFAEGAARLVIPYLGVARPVENGQTVTIRLNPVSMPVRLP